MSTDYEAGTVATATVRGIEGVRIVRCGGVDQQGFWWTPEFCGDILGNEPQWRMHADQYVTDVRPLVVLDLAAGEAKELADYLTGVDMHLSIGDRLSIARQIEAQTKPPRIPEPGLWGVVRGKVMPDIPNDDYWVRLDGLWHNSDGHAAMWDELIDPVLIREGLS